MYYMSLYKVIISLNEIYIQTKYTMSLKLKFFAHVPLSLTYTLKPTISEFAARIDKLKRQGITLVDMEHPIKVTDKCQSLINIPEF